MMTVAEQASNTYEQEVGHFSKLLKENQRYAFDRYGWTLFFSIPAEERHELRHELGWKDSTALDFYNTGSVECRSGKIKEGLAKLEKAEAMGLHLPELWFNLGVAYEKTGKPAEAKKFYQKFADEIERRIRVPIHYREDLDVVRDRLSEL